MKRLFSKRERTEIEKRINSLKKIISKTDDISIQESVEQMIKLASFNPEILAETFTKITSKKNSFINDFAHMIMRLDKEIYSIDIIQLLIDYCFRFGNAETQKTGVTLLAKYADNDDLKDRYKLVFLKDKKAYKYLQDKIYNK